MAFPPHSSGMHWVSVRLQRLTVDNFRKDVPPLDEAASISYGAEVIAELFTFSVALVLLLQEYNASAEKSAKEKAALQQRLNNLEAAVIELSGAITALRPPGNAPALAASVPSPGSSSSNSSGSGSGGSNNSSGSSNSSSDTSSNSSATSASSR